jgi:hypothetical protein
VSDTEVVPPRSFQPRISIVAGCEKRPRLGIATTKNMSCYVSVYVFNRLFADLLSKARACEYKFAMRERSQTPHQWRSHTGTNRR